MQKGRGIEKVLEELVRQNSVKKDYVAEVSALSVDFVEGNNKPVLRGINGPLELTEWAHKQFSKYLKIPNMYYNKMRLEDKKLFADNANTWLRIKEDNRLIRVVDNRIRAFLPTNYRPVDCLDLGTNLLPVFKENGLNVVSSEVTETNFYLKALILEKEFEIKSKVVGDVLNFGVAVRGSEVGAGGIKIEPFVNRLVCTNGMIASKSIKEFGLTKGDEWGEVNKFFSKETLSEINTAFIMKVKDVIKGIMSDEAILALIDKLQNAFLEKVAINRPEVFINKLVSFLGVTKAKEDITKNFIEDADYSRYGAMNAITKAANAESNYDFATALEYAGDKVLSLSQTQWNVLQHA